MHSTIEGRGLRRRNATGAVRVAVLLKGGFLANSTVPSTESTSSTTLMGSRFELLLSLDATEDPFWSHEYGFP